jgi:hypothetical protein
MTTSSAATESTLRRRVAPLVIAIAVLVLVVLVVGPTAGPDPEQPLDPTSARDDGLLGLIRTLEGLETDVEVTVAPPEDPDARAFLPVDLLSREESVRWRDWVAGGGTLVVADRWSDLHDRQVAAAPFGERFVGIDRTPGCALLPAVVDEVVHDTWVGVEHDADEPTCFEIDPPYSWLVATSLDAGTVILLGSATPFTNAWLERGDNALLAVALLAPQPGDRVIVIPRSDRPDVELGLLDLVADGIWRALTLGALAVVVAIIARARRLGRPVPERLPPVLPSVELATSLAGLSRRAEDRGGAAATLRARARRSVERALGAAPGTDPTELAARLADRSRLDVSTIETALVDGPVTDDLELVAVSDAVSLVFQKLAATSSSP